MKRRNFNKSILQQGGLMIEALAMLGLIAVVTPTMYKKSAERTMEVEDINTAATIRTINAAANDYVSANYSTILGDMVKNNETNRKLNIEDLKAYLPYGFDVKKALYNYDGEHIQLSVSRPDGSNNLTTLMLFPAKLDEENGIGQERTSRIAALIGSSGGYVTDTNKARGIGGIWELSGDSYTKNFNSANKYSIVTASADTISASAGNEMDYSKYLQRGQDPDDTNSQWKNTMRTDLYMGGPEGSSEDVYREATGPHSIRNINSLIVGANTSGGVDGEGNDLADAGGYGLYVAPGAANPNAYIHGSLEAGNGQLNADENNLKYGTGTDDDGNSWVGFNVDKEGTISNLKDLNLAKKAGNWTSILIGALENDGDDKNYIIKAQPRDGESLGKVSLLGDDIVSLSGYASKDNYMPYPNRRKASSDRVVILNNGWKTDENLQYIDEPQYNSEPSFPMRVGANAKYQGILAAGQLDTQKIRAASLSVGSHNIDDNEKWLNVNQYGVTMADIHHENNGDYDPQGTYASFNQAGILLRADNGSHPVSDDDKGGGANYKVGGQNTSEHAIQLNLRTNKEFAGGKTLSNVAELFADNTDIRGKEIARVSGQGTIIQAKSEIREWKDDYDSIWKDETQDFKDTVGPNTLLLRNDNMQMKMQDNQLTIVGRNTIDNNGNTVTPTDTRTLFKSGSVDLDGANFNIKSAQKQYAADKMIFSVRPNDSYGNNAYKNTFASDPLADTTDRNTSISDTGYNFPYNITMHGNILLGNGATGEEALDIGSNPYKQYYISVGQFNQNAGVNIAPYLTGGINSKGKNNQYTNIVYIDQGATDTTNRNINNSETRGNVDPGTIYIRKGYVEVHGDDVAFVGNNDIDIKNKPEANKGNGVIVASRLVANNPTSGSYGATAPQLVTSNYKLNDEDKNYNITVSRNNGTTTSELETEINRYDTYMVNPAYTSVMHDIKLTTRGGARLSDILPDFINKGIYVVSNTISEQYNQEHTGEKGELKFNGYIKIVDDKTTSLPDGNGSKYSISSKEDINFSTERAWASPFLGAVPAPQCPPGYGRVITLSPYSFEMAQAGVLNKTKRFYDDPLSTNNASTGKTGIKNVAKDSYYVMPVNNANEVKSSLTPPEYAKANVVSASDADIQIDATNSSMGTINGTLDKLDGLSTQQYVLSSPTATDSSTTPVKPLFFQQSTRIKSATVPLVKGMETSLETEPSKLDGKYVQGWAAIIGFIYPAKMYSAFTGNDNSGFYWNLFPVMRGTINGYATVYCYFDRTNMYKRYNSNYSDYVDRQDYMKTMTGVPDSPQKTDSSYTKRLNDPNMKYNEVW